MVRPLPLAAGLALAAASLLASGRARASDLPAGGGLLAVTARVDAAHGTLEYGTCSAPPCAITDHEKVRVDGAIDPRKVRTTLVDMGGGRHAMWVHVDAQDGKSWDAVLAGRTPALVYSSPTGYQRGQVGSMTGQVVQLVPTDGGSGYIARGDVSEDVTLCGRPALLRAEILDPKTLGWRGASFQRLSEKDREDATPIVATARASAGDKPLAPLLAPRATSSSTSPRALVDMDPSTAWSEDRGGVGRGEFVVLSAPSDVPIARLAVTVAPPAPSANGAAPKSFYLATSDRVFEVTLPEDAWLHPGATYDITLPEPLKSSCLALVLDEAYVRSGQAKPDVTVAELWAYSELDGPNASLASVAAELGAGGRKAEVAAGILKRAGDAALAGVVAAWDKLDTYGRSLALDVGEGASCGSPASQLFVRGLCDKDSVVARKAEVALQRCGRSSHIVDAVKAAPTVMCPKVPTYLALLGQASALPLLADLVASGSTMADRADARHAFATAARNAPASVLTAMIGDTKRDPHTRLELLRAISPRLQEIAPEATATLDALLGPSADFTTRYLALEPLAALAKSGDRASAVRVGTMLAHDPEWPVRARAAELARELPAVQSELVAAVDDTEPRVRQAALDAVAELRVSPAAVLVEKHLEPSEPWTFVRVSAARNAPASVLTAMIGDAKRDPHTRLELLRAISPRLPEIAPEATATLDALLGPSADFTTRYLALEPLAALAKSGDRASAVRVGTMLAHDPDWPVRARAAELARELPAVQSELVAAVDDTEPRVRQAALDAVAELHVSPAAVLVEKHLEPSEPWTFVRVSAARALGAMPAARDLDKALADALAGDESARVRGAIIQALAAHRATAYSEAIRARLDDGQELVEVRAAAARALGSLCEAKQLDRLTQLARAAADPMASADELELGLAAVDALGEIHPADLAGRLAKLRDKSVRDAVRAAAEHALSVKGACH